MRAPEYEVPVEPGVDEAFVLTLVERVRSLRDNTSYGLLNPKFKRLQELYKPLEQRVTQQAVDELSAEIERLEQT